MGKLERRLRYWLQQSERQKLLREEMEFHLEALTEDLEAQGTPQVEAHTAARRRFGNMTQKTEDARVAWISRWIEDAVQDLRYNVRTLRRDTSFAVFAILIIGLGIGASSTIFSVVRALLLRPLPFPDARALVWMGNKDVDDEGLSGETVPVGHFLDLRDHNHSFADVAAYSPFYRPGDIKLTEDGEPQRLTAVTVSHNFFSVLGVSPLMGRPLNPEDCKIPWNAPRVALLSYSLWQRRFNSDPAMVGRVLTLNDGRVTVVGIMPPSFDFGSVFAPGTHVDLYLPFPLTEQANRRGNELIMLGRLRPNSTIESARTEIKVLGPRIKRRDPDRNFQPVLSLLGEHVSGHLRPALLTLAGAVGVVMLIVCANLSNLLLARNATRQREMAVRVALGAGRHRLMRQMLTETLTLSCAGAVIGLLLAVIGTRSLAHLSAFSIPLLDTVHIDVVAFAFTLVIAVVTGLVFGLVPALQIPAVAVHDQLKDSSRGSSQGRDYTSIRSLLMVSEIAFACVLLVGAGLLIRSFLRVLDVSLGFQPDRAAAMRVDPSSHYSTQALRNRFYDEALGQVRAIPGIEAAGLTDVLPLGGDRTWSAMAKGRTYTKAAPPPWAFVRIVSDGYLRAMGIPLRAGRDLTARDTASNAPVILINETLARTLWPGQNAVGKVLVGAGYVDREVVGVVSDVRHLAVEQASGCEMYLPIRQSDDYSSVDLVVRTTLAPTQLAPAVRQTLRAIDPTQPANEFRMLREVVDRAVSPRRFLAVLLGGFSGFALILAVLGIYGVISYSVNQRTQEIGIRMALGASPGDVQARILSQTLRLAGFGMVVGLAGSWVLSRTISGLLFGVTPTDPLTFAGILVLLTAVSAFAGYLPARRASRIDPAGALRSS